MHTTLCYISFSHLTSEQSLAGVCNVRGSFGVATLRTEILIISCSSLCSTAGGGEQKVWSWFMTIEFFSFSSGNIFLHCSLYLFCKD